MENKKLPRTKSMFNSWVFIMTEEDEDYHHFVAKLSGMRYLAYQTVPGDKGLYMGWVYSEREISKKHILGIIPSFLWDNSSPIVKVSEYIESKRLGQLVEVGSAPIHGRPKRKRDEADVKVTDNQKDLKQANQDLKQANQDLKQANQDLKQANQDQVCNMIESIKRLFEKNLQFTFALASIYEQFPLKNKLFVSTLLNKKDWTKAMLDYHPDHYVSDERHYFVCGEITKFLNFLRDTHWKKMS
jgi:hypothetical protein